MASSYLSPQLLAKSCSGPTISGNNQTDSNGLKLVSSASYIVSYSLLILL